MDRRDRDILEDLVRRTLGRRAGRGSLRAADVDREATASLLRRSHAEGRLDTAELEERMGRCYAAKTFGQLDALVVDLPAVHPPAQRRSAKRLPVRLAAFVAVLVVIQIVAHGRIAWVLWPVAVFVVLRLIAGRSRRLHL